MIQIFIAILSLLGINDVGKPTFFGYEPPTRIEDRIFAVFSISYNDFDSTTDRQKISLGVIGMATQINDSTFMSAYHIFKKAYHSPAIGFKKQKIWLLKITDTKAIEVLPEMLTSNPEIDVTFLKLKEKIKVAPCFIAPNIGLKYKDTVSGYFINNIKHFKVETDYSNGDLRLKSYLIDSGKIIKYDGVLRDIFRTNIPYGDEEKIVNKTIYKILLTTLEGYSGSAIFKNGKIVGMLLAQLPPYYPQSDTCIAMASSEIYKFHK
jgi:hypothetical protein